MVPVDVILIMADIAAGNAPCTRSGSGQETPLQVWVSVHYTRQIKEVRTYAIVHHPFIALPRRISSSAYRSTRVSCAPVVED